MSPCFNEGSILDPLTQYKEKRLSCAQKISGIAAKVEAQAVPEIA
jgi:hypothetical protein